MIFTKKNFLIIFYVLVIGTSGYKFSFFQKIFQIFKKFLEISNAHAQLNNAHAQF